MTNFDQLNPALQHHIVNSLGWRELRPFQEEVIPPLLEGKHVIVIAPTAGGKTEAAFFPIASRMLSEGWTGLSVLYICPIKALLNNLEVRLQRYSTLLGRRTALWHGDVKTSARKKIIQDPPDCLLTTPESLELMLVSTNVDARSLFAQLRVVIVDEIHAFAGDDRGWHLLAVLERVTRLAGRELQRIGLSATVGNPQDLLSWLAGSCEGQKTVCSPQQEQVVEADVRLDYVGSLNNAAVVISRLHRGEKRLVFVDSRARSEQLGAELRNLGVASYVTHSSLSHDQRRHAEEAFASRDNCVIVATSVLELGIDVGDLDRVIQIDAPSTVSSFLQRMGRTGRRTGTTRNCLFLATRVESLLQAAGLIELWSQGYVEPVEPPARPYHILAQQLMALTLQERGIGRDEWRSWVQRVPGFAAIPESDSDRIVTWMIEKGILFDDAGILWFGREGEDAFGRRNFMDLLSVFTSPPLFRVLHGRQELGYVDELTFLTPRGDQRVLLLGGRAWQVTHIDWYRRIAYVEAVEKKGRSRWKGEERSLSFQLCRQVQSIVTTERDLAFASNRAREVLANIRSEYTGIKSDATTIVVRNGVATWWTFAGARANTILAGSLGREMAIETAHDNFCVSIHSDRVTNELVERVSLLRGAPKDTLRADIAEDAIDGLKFSQCLPPNLAKYVLAGRLQDVAATEMVLADMR